MHRKIEIHIHTHMLIPTDLNPDQNNNNPYPGMYPAVYLIPNQQGHIPPQETARPANSNGDIRKIY